LARGELIDVHDAVLEAADYAGIGRARTVFTADLADQQ
jgi:hypothetical protein